MKKALCLIAVLAWVAMASADVRVFTTSSSSGYGLTVPANHDDPTFSSVNAGGANTNAYDFYYHHFEVAAYPPVDAPSGTLANPVNIAQGDWAYIWLQFRDEPKGVGINGLAVNITGPAGFATTYYVQNDKGNLADSQKRWDGTATPPDYVEWHANPQSMVAVQAVGIVNGVDDAQMMFDYQTGTNPRTGVALLGAIDNLGPGTYQIDIININYTDDTHPAVSSGVFQMVPEPASALLLGLVSLLIRRR